MGLCVKLNGPPNFDLTSARPPPPPRPHRTPPPLATPIWYRGEESGTLSKTMDDQNDARDGGRRQGRGDNGNAPQAIPDDEPALDGYAR